MQEEVLFVPIYGLNECHYHGKCVKLHGLILILLYYLAHVASVLILSHFWCLIHVLSTVYRWLTPVEVSSETPIHRLTIFFHLPVSPPSSWHLMMVWTILKSTLYVELGSGKVTSLSNKSSTFLPSWMRRVMSPHNRQSGQVCDLYHYPPAISRH